MTPSITWLSLSVDDSPKLVPCGAAAAPPSVHLMVDCVAGSLPDMHNMALFSIGASFLLRSAGCTINDLW